VAAGAVQNEFDGSKPSDMKNKTKTKTQKSNMSTRVLLLTTSGIV
jgi:hypothetical protein